jgi:hypothetical protein
LPSLTEFSPLEHLDLPGIGKVDCSGLILIVGPSSSGKSQLLRDIHQRVSGDPRKLVVASEVRVTRLPYEPLVAALAEAGFIYRFEDDGGAPHVRPLTTYVGTGQAANQVQVNQLQSWHNTHNAAGAAVRRLRDEYLGYFGRFLVTALFLDHRLTSLHQAGMIDFVNGPPQHDLHALYLNDSAREQLFAEVRSSFAKAVWPDISRGTGVCLRVSDQGDIPTPEDRLSPTKMNNYRTIETEGDGLKSYVATCVALLLGRRPLCLVDEPEMCLHPPQAYNLGRFIGEFGSSKEAATFVATHSSHVLRGVIQRAPKLQIVRLTRLGSAFRAHLVPPEILEGALKKPTVRAESVLDGIFAQAVVVLEADGDRTVYQAAWETLGREVRLDIHFTTVGGTGGIADTCTLYSALRIPVAVVADLDILSDTDHLERVLQSLGASNASQLSDEARRVIGLVKQLPPTISEADVRTQILEAIPTTLDWAQEHDATLRTRLQQLARRLDRMRRLKTATSEPLPEYIREPLQALIEGLRLNGLFVVPVGELEEWLATRNIRASKQNKWAWANEAASLIRAVGPQSDDVWAFIGSVGDYLQARFTEFAS